MDTKIGKEYNKCVRKGSAVEIAISITPKMQNNQRNLKAISCYETLGFKEYKRDKNVKVFEGNFVDDIYMKYVK